MPPADTRPRHALPRHWLRVGVALVVVLVLHALAALWLTHSRDAFTPPAPAEIPVQIELLKPQPIERAPAPKPAEPPAKQPAKPAAAAPKPAAKPAPSPEPVLTSTQTDERGEPPQAASAASAASGA
ncbi:TPA: DUF3108 domain-containing protein, partial [Burkholderia territorii]|nr:DUF3108 domain-containing protein [Burkholderia territorii]